MMEPRKLVGRHSQLRRFDELLASRQPIFLAVHGRRRVGKTFLIREGLKENITLELVGMKDGPLRNQLENFALALGKASAGNFPEKGVPKSWPEAFRELEAWGETLSTERKHVIFFDELPWLAGPRSRFLPALDHFWNSWGSRQNNLILVVCGSAASWMIRKLLHDKGGLHNRVTHQMRLEPFDLAESRELLQSRGVSLTDYQVIELYMAFGGVPLYLEQARRGESATQIIDRVCFSREGLLRDEFSKLYPALFDSPERHVQIVRALAAKSAGLTRNEIAAATKQSPSGRLTTTLDELRESDFIRSSAPYGKRAKDTIYRLADEFSLFHLRWMERWRGDASGGWQKMRGTPKWRAWSGLAFETLCFKHISQIKAALGIAGVSTETASWLYRPSDKAETGAQIDLLIDRADACINLCEMKFSEAEFVIDKRYAKQLRERRETFRRITKTRKNAFHTFVTISGVKDNDYARELVDSSVGMKALFEPS